MSRAGGVAAFFDLDGTLASLPSFEWRLFRSLHAQGLISATTYFVWLRDTLRIATRGIGAARHESKSYLRNFPVRDIALCCEQELRSPERLFFEESIDRLLWHAGEGHAIVVLSGTLYPLARPAIRALEAAAEGRGARVQFLVRATQLEEQRGRCTGRVAGHAMFGPAKAKAMEQLALQNHWDLAQCFAYGDSFADCCMLERAGRPTAVNPSPALRWIARKRGWPIIRWQAKSHNPADTGGGIGVRVREPG